MGIEISTSADIVSTLEELNPEALMYEGFDEALVGITARHSTGPLALYDREKCIDILIERGMTAEEAEEYFCFHVEGCWEGPQTPFIASFNLDPVGVPRLARSLESAEADGELFVGQYIPPADESEG